MVGEKFGHLIEAMGAKDISKLDKDQLKNIIDAVMAIDDRELRAMQQANKLQVLQGALASTLESLDVAESVKDAELQAQFKSAIRTLIDKISYLKKPSA